MQDLLISASLALRLEACVCTSRFLLLLKKSSVDENQVLTLASEHFTKLSPPLPDLMLCLSGQLHKGIRMEDTDTKDQREPLQKGMFSGSSALTFWEAVLTMAWPLGGIFFNPSQVGFSLSYLHYRREPFEMALCGFSAALSTLKESLSREVAIAHDYFGAYGVPRRI